MYISKVQLKNIRCFVDLTLDFSRNDSFASHALFVGDNATGKTTLIKSIAMGLCDESSAASLMTEVDAGYVRKGKISGKIIISLKPTQNSKKIHRISTTITRRGSREQLRQVTTKDFPWGKLFVCGYGAGRSTSGSGDITGYTVLNAVYNLFNYSEGLQNPELALLRISKPKIRHHILNILGKLLQTENISHGDKGIMMDGPWGSGMPLRDLADGYKSSFLWTMDFIGWAFSRDPTLTDIRSIVGIILIDEIEQNLHPKWQQQIISRLREQLPNVQILATTHSPLVAGSVGKLDVAKDSGDLIQLELLKGNVVEANRIKSMRGWRADQILASQAFDYTISSDREIDALLREASILSSRGDKRTKAEEKRFKNIKATIARALISEEETPIEREIRSDLNRKMMKRVRELEMKLMQSSE